MRKLSEKGSFIKYGLAGKWLPVAAALVPLSVIPSSVNAMVSIIVSGTVDLNFGSMTAGTAGGTVTMSTAGVRSKTGSVTLLGGAGLESNAVLSISGSTGMLIDVSMTAGAFTVDDGGGGGGAPMTVNAFDIDGGGVSASVTLATNPATFPLGGTLTVAAGQAEGVYSGTYTVSANYQ